MSPIDREEYEARHQELQRQITDLHSKLGEIETLITSGKVDIWKLLATNLLTVVVGFVAGYLAHWIR